MTVKQAKSILRHPDIVLVLTALSYVNLTDKELRILMLRHMRGHTQEETAEELEMSSTGVHTIGRTALDKCAAVWEGLSLTREMLKSATL